MSTGDLNLRPEIDVEVEDLRLNSAPVDGTLLATLAPSGAVVMILRTEAAAVELTLGDESARFFGRALMKLVPKPARSPKPTAPVDTATLEMFPPPHPVPDKARLCGKLLDDQVPDGNVCRRDAGHAGACSWDPDHSFTGGVA